ncbi:N-acetyl-alpha-D-glucosaminyl-diphospho-ditrans,octacis-undecaprenol 4-epimerase [subsurface metagenome]
MTKVLITGADSFVGTNYIKYSQNKEVDEISLIDNQPEEIDFSSYDVILHLVAIVHQLKTISEEEYFKVNKGLCLRTAEEAKKAGVKQFVFLSTVKVYGEFNPESGPWTENSKCYPEDPYGKSKYEAETELRKLEDNDFTVSTIRTPLVYGKDVRANMLSIMKLVDRIRILPFGNVNNKRSFTYTKNLIGFIDRIIEKRASGVFIAMDSKPLSTTGLVKLIAKYLDKKVILFNIPVPLINFGKKIMPRIFDRLYGSFEMENNQTLKQLDFVPQYSNEEGIKEMVTAYLEQKNKKKK